MPKFTVVLIAKNESKTLPRLITSLNEFMQKGGEVILVDTGSTDGTPDVARSLGCIVEEVGEKFIITVDEKTAEKINTKFVFNSEYNIVAAGDRMFDYSSARNYAASLSKTDMIAMPDCDEMYTKLDLDVINNEIENGADQFRYNFVYAHDDKGNEIVKFEHSKFYNKQKMKWVGIIHEVLKENEPIKQIYLSEGIIKLEHWQNEETNRSHYLVGLAYDCYMNPTNDRNAHYLGRELYYTGRYYSSIFQLQRHIEMNGWQPERSSSMVYIGDAYMALDKREKAFTAYQKAFDIEPARREPLMRMAEYYYKIGKFQNAVSYAAAALQIKPSYFYMNYKPYYEHLPHEIMYWGLWYLGDKEGSREHFKKCLEYQPDNEKYLSDKNFYL